MGKTGKSRRTPTPKVSTQQNVAFGKDPDRDERFFRTLFCDPWQIWNDRRATRQLRTHVVWGMMHPQVVRILHNRNVNVPELRELSNKLTDFSFPAKLIEATNNWNKQILPRVIKVRKKRNRTLDQYAQIEDAARAIGDDALLQSVKDKRPRDPVTGKHEEIIPLSVLRQVALKRPRIKRLGNVRRPQVVAFRRTASDELKRFGISRARRSKIIGEMEMFLGISGEFYYSHSGNYDDPRRIDTIWKSIN